MKVHQITTRDEGLTNPKRSVWGVTLALRWGDVCHPLGKGDWFKPPYFSRLLRFYSWFPLPFIAWNLWGWRGYLGAKVYGVDSPDYKNWIAPDEVYDGSQAIQFSGRLKISD
jgi:hypothetical protein